MTDYNDNSPFVVNEKTHTHDEGFKKKVFDPKIYLNVKLAEDEKKRDVRIRILPANPGSRKISTDIRIHSMKVPTEVTKSGFKSFICLNDSHILGDERGCPFCNVFEDYKAEAMKLKDPDGNVTNTTQWKALWKEAYRHEAKIAHIVRVIDRDHEDEGVKFWRFNEWDNGKGCYDYLKEIYNLYNEEAAKIAYLAEYKKTPTSEQLAEYMKNDKGETREFYNVFNLENGHDIKLTLTHGENSKDRTEIKIMAELSESPLSYDENEVSKWVNDPKSWNDAYAVKNYDYLEVVLNGGVPVYDSTVGKYVSKEERERNEEETEREAAEEVLNVMAPENGNTEDEDLPF